MRYGRQAIVLVPEISLTPQTVERFRRRFGAVAVLHSHLSDADRHWHWQRIAEGRVSVVVGARSAIFAPTPHLGLIVLDEEHESTFKQEIAPRYHAREVAVARAAAENVPLILGSATPSLESWNRARLGQYQLIEMPRRVLNRPLPEVGTIDLRAEGQRIGESRQHQPPAAPGDPGRLARRWPGDPAAESPRLLDAHPVPGLRRGGALSRLRHRADASQDGRPGPLPLVRLPHRAADELPGLRLGRNSLLGPGHAEAGGRSAGPFPQCPAAPHGRRHDAGPRGPRKGPRRISRRARPASCWARR